MHLWHHDNAWSGIVIVLAACGVVWLAAWLSVYAWRKLHG
jgi:hypothetical protein